MKSQLKMDVSLKKLGETIQTSTVVQSATHRLNPTSSLFNIKSIESQELNGPVMPGKGQLSNRFNSSETIKSYLSQRGSTLPETARTNNLSAGKPGFEFVVTSA